MARRKAWVVFEQEIGLGKSFPSLTHQYAGEHLARYERHHLGLGLGCVAVDTAIKLEEDTEVARTFGALTSKGGHLLNAPAGWTAELTCVTADVRANFETSGGIFFL